MLARATDMALVYQVSVDRSIVTGMQILGVVCSVYVADRRMLYADNNTRTACACHVCVCVDNMIGIVLLVHFITRSD